MEPFPLVTAIIPLHNHANWIMDATQSIISQDYNNKRIVIVDDGSIDGGYLNITSRLEEIQNGIVDDLEGKPEYWIGHLNNDSTPIYLIKYKDGDCHGPSFARNRGIELLSGDTDIYAFLDSDDTYIQGKISKSVQVLNKYPEVGAIYSDYETFRSDGIVIREFKEPYSRKRLLEDCIINCDSLVRAKAIKECGGFDQEMRVAEDFDLWLRISERYLLYHIPECLVRIRVGLHNSTSTVQKEVWNKCYQRLSDKLRQRLNVK